MKTKISLKTLYRSPVKTVLTFILLAAVTFALFSQVLEYVVNAQLLPVCQFRGESGGAVFLVENAGHGSRLNGDGDVDVQGAYLPRRQCAEGILELELFTVE